VRPDSSPFSDWFSFSQQTDDGPSLVLSFSPQGRTYDPIFHAATRPQNAEPQTIFSARGLALVAVPWPWAMALKLVRYEKKDPDDCVAIIRLGFAQRGIRWTVAGLEQWISDRCWPMGYNNYQPPQKAQLRQRIRDVIARTSLPSPPDEHFVFFFFF